MHTDCISGVPREEQEKAAEEDLHGAARRELQHALAERTLRLCEARSPIGEERSLCDSLVLECARAFPGAVERIGNSLVLGRLTGAKPGLAFFGHLDTVPLQAGDFPARREGGRIFGRGASDMKGGLAVLLELFDRLRPEGLASLPVEPIAVLYDREEGPYAESGLGPVLEQRRDLHTAALALCLEPTDLALQIGCCGSMHATFTFAGRSAHSARPWQGENAIHKAGALLVHLQGLAPVEVKFDLGLEGTGPLVFREVLNVTRIEGFTGRNVVPASVALNLNLRFAPGKSVDAAEAELQALAARFGAQCTVTDRSPSGAVVTDNPYLRNLQSYTKCQLEAKQAWTDVARLTALGIPAANFGPGDQAQAHQKNESCPEAALLVAYDALKNLLETP
jgi:succinyl-diaminopimelate desuccinylase